MARSVVSFVTYVALIALAVGLFLVIASHGDALTGGGAEHSVPHAPGPSDELLHVILALAVIILAARLCGWAFAKLHQPAVLGEMIAGILLGPSVLGRVAPEMATVLLPEGLAPQLRVIANVGIIVYMFLVGVELDSSAVRRKSHAALAISHASIILPFVLGALVALLAYPRVGSADVSFTVFALFLGVAMSVTAFPVLARILSDRGLTRTSVGALAIACAAVDDVTAWCLLAFVVGVVKAEPGTALTTVLLTAAYGVGMIALGRPLVRRLVAYHGRRGLTRGVLTTVLVALLGSAFATEWIGIHALFGAFLVGALIPHDSALATDLIAKLEDVIVVFLLPAFFAFTGMRTRIDLVAGADAWLLCGLLILVASVGKFGGSFLAGLLSGIGARAAAAVGILMNTRGLMELVVLNVGLDLGVIGPTLFTMMVMMAIVTTLATTPLLQLLEPRRWQTEAAVAELRAS